MNRLLAWQRRPAAGKELDLTEWLTPVLGFVVAVVVGAILIRKVGSYLRRRRRAEEDLDVLTDFRSLKQRGELTDEEFQKIRAAVSRRTRKKDARAESASGGSPPKKEDAAKENFGEIDDQ